MGIIHIVVLVPWAVYESLVIMNSLNELNALFNEEDPTWWTNLQEQANLGVQMALYVAMIVFIVVMMAKMNTATFREQCAAYREKLSK